MKLSIITINYNNKGGLEKTVQSVMFQTWRDFEWIIIDGGSTDGSAEFIAELAKNPRSNISYWCSEKDNGIYNAMNKGIAKAQGEYLQFLNSGDCFYESSTLEKVSAYKLNSDIIVGVTIKYGKGQEIVWLPPQPSEITLSFMLNHAICHQSCFISSNLMNRYKYDEKYKIASDWKFMLLALIKEKCTYHVLPFFVTKYLEGGLSSNIVLSLYEREEILKDLFSKKEIHKAYKIKEWDTLINSINPLSILGYGLMVLIKFYIFVRSLYNTCKIK